MEKRLFCLVAMARLGKFCMGGFCEIIPNFCEIASAMQDIRSQKIL